MSSLSGETLTISIFGQSHGEAVGVVIDGLPAGEEIDVPRLCEFLRRRAPGQNNLSTTRKETDLPRFLSGVLDGRTCGAPLCAVIENRDTRSEDYEKLGDTPRPSHADYPAHVRGSGWNDIRGGGHFSGRLTAPLCVAGGIALQLLERRGVAVGAHLEAVGTVRGRRFNPVSLTPAELSEPGKRAVPALDEDAAARMEMEIRAAAADQDSVGGIVECAVLGLPPGLGEPMFSGLENRLSAALFAIPACRGVEFGSGFASAAMRGSQNNDPYCIRNGAVATRSNHHGGILGGLSTGMPVLFRAAFKPTPSIAREQQTVSLSSKSETNIRITGRHDPCIAIRAVPCVEAAAAVIALDLMLSSRIPGASFS